MVDDEAEHDHLERISLLSAGLMPDVEDVAAIDSNSPSTKGGTWCGAHRPEILKHVAQFSANSLNIVTLFEPTCVITGSFSN